MYLITLSLPQALALLSWPIDDDDWIGFRLHWNGLDLGGRGKVGVTMP